MNATNNDTVTAALGLIEMGLEVEVDIARDERHSFGLETDLLRLVQGYGLREVLNVLHDAALMSAEMHEDEVGDEDASDDLGMHVLRLRVFANRLSSATNVLAERASVRFSRKSE